MTNKEYLLNDYHKIIIESTEDNRFKVMCYELTGNSWMPLGPSEYWGKLEDIKWEYGIE